jgi:hypothetical protein
MFSSLSLIPFVWQQVGTHHVDIVLVNNSKVVLLLALKITKLSYGSVCLSTAQPLAAKYPV